MSTDIAQERLTRRIQELYASDPQFLPLPALTRRYRPRWSGPVCGCRNSCKPSLTATQTGPRSGSARCSSSKTPATGRTIS